MAYGSNGYYGLATVGGLMQGAANSYNRGLMMMANLEEYRDNRADRAEEKAYRRSRDLINDEWNNEKRNDYRQDRKIKAAENLVGIENEFTKYGLPNVNYNPEAAQMYRDEMGGGLNQNRTTGLGGNLQQPTNTGITSQMRPTTSQQPANNAWRATQVDGRTIFKNNDSGTMFASKTNKRGNLEPDFNQKVVDKPQGAALTEAKTAQELTASARDFGTRNASRLKDNLTQESVQGLIQDYLKENIYSEEYGAEGRGYSDFDRRNISESMINAIARKNGFDAEETAQLREYANNASLQSISVGDSKFAMTSDEIAMTQDIINYAAPMLEDASGWNAGNILKGDVLYQGELDKVIDGAVANFPGMPSVIKKFGGSYEDAEEYVRKVLTAEAMVRHGKDYDSSDKSVGAWAGNKFMQGLGWTAKKASQGVGAVGGALWEGTKNRVEQESNPVNRGGLRSYGF